MLSVQKTYNVFRTIKGVSKTKPIVDEPNGEISYTPAPVPLAIYALEPSKTKTVKDSLEEFFGLFTKEQADILKTKTDYDGWLKIVSEKNKLPLDMINTDAELSEIDTILKK